MKATKILDKVSFCYNKPQFSPLTFTAAQANSTIQLVQVGSPYQAQLKYKLNNEQTWSDYQIRQSNYSF